MSRFVEGFGRPDFGERLADAIDRFIVWVQDHFAWLFDLVRWPIEKTILGLEGFLLWLPWPVVILVVGAMAWKTGKSRLALICGGGLALIIPLGLWDLAMTTLSMTLTAMAFSVVLGVPLGILASRDDRVDAVVRAILDGMQTIHPFVYLVPIVSLFGIGKTPGTIATIVVAMPPTVRLTNLGIRQVPAATVEAARAFGANRRQLLWEVQLPLAMPSIMAGINQSLMLALSMVVIVALIAGGGLGQEIYRAIGRVDVGRACVGGLAVFLLAIVLDRISQTAALEDWRTGKEG